MTSTAHRAYSEERLCIAGLMGRSVAKPEGQGYDSGSSRKDPSVRHCDLLSQRPALPERYLRAASLIQTPPRKPAPVCTVQRLEHQSSGPVVRKELAHGSVPNREEAISALC